MIPYIVYAHSEYADILSAQTHYLSSYENKVLLIDKSGAELTDICSKYKQVLFYDDNLPYASRLLKLTELDLDYVLFIHDIDVLVVRDDEVVEYVLDKMIEHNIDRVDLKYKNIPLLEKILIDKNDNDFVLTKSNNNIDNYIYNVNPSIWKVSVFMEIMSKFKNETYRTIEGNESGVQAFCSQYRMFALHGESYINCGHFGCMPFFQYIHLTHGGKLLSRTTNPKDCGPYQNIHHTLQGAYQSTIDDFNLTDTREFDPRYYGSDYHHGPSIKKKNKTKPNLLISIGGSSGCGKTYLSDTLYNIIGQSECQQLSGDDAHKWPRGDPMWEKYTHLNPYANKLKQEWDYLKSLKNNEPILRSKYNHVTGEFDLPIRISPSPVLLYESLHAYNEDISDIIDLFIFVETSDMLKLKWKIERDTKNRGYTEQEVLDILKQRSLDEEKYIKPQKKHADIIVNLDLCREKVIMDYQIVNKKNNFEELLKLAKQVYNYDLA